MKLSQTISLLGDVTLVDAVQMTANENLVEFKDGLFQDCIDLTDKNLRLELKLDTMCECPTATDLNEFKAQAIRDMFECGEIHGFNINCSNFEERYIQPVLKVAEENDNG